MTIDELRKACETAIAGGIENVTLALPADMKCVGKGWPRGEVICQGEKTKVMRFKALAVLRYIKKAEEGK